MTSPLNTFVSTHQARVEGNLARLFDAAVSQQNDLQEAMQYSLLGGGKRIRAVLAYAAAQACGDINATTDYFANALECVHAYSLVHDDLPAMDDDALRRGKPTCHIAFNEATAILAGDALQCLAFECLAQAPAPAATIVAAIKQLSHSSGFRGMVLGQAIDLNAVNTNLDVDQLEHMHLNKTGALIEASVVLGALSVQGTDVSTSQLDTSVLEADIAALRHYARAIGLAFQVQDDILDVTVDTQTLGKNQGADLKLNKPTYVSLLGLEGAKKKAQSLRDDAIAALKDMGERGFMLKELANYIVNRRY
ncbi:MAG: geranylgeranyl pyrophosphate synthase [Lentisphaeria bacterium]|jgi:geranylgeranyl pyrophosphate synthase